MQQVADENGLEIQAALPAVATGEASAAQQEQDSLTRRYSGLIIVARRKHFFADWQHCANERGRVLMGSL